MQVFTDCGRSISLSAADFVAHGGQGAVYARNGVAYKVYHRPCEMVSPTKLTHLATLSSPDVLGPTGSLHDIDGVTVGYTMAFVPRTYPLCRLYPRAFRARHGLTVETCVRLVYAMAETLEGLHQQGCLVVDLNPFNVLVDPSFDRAYFIDVDSYQVPGHAATALMETVRDRHAPPGLFTVGTDWFSFAVTTFQVFTGVHPYRGKHPHLTTLDDRMQAEVSVFDPSVVLPPAATPVTAIPEALRTWYRDVFQNRLRTPPPPSPGRFDTITPRRIRDGLAVNVEVTDRFPSPVRRAVTVDGRTVVVTGDGVYYRGKRVGRAPDGPAFIGFSAVRGRPVVGALERAGLWLWNAHDQETLAFGMALDALCEADGRLYGRSGRNLVELRLAEAGPTMVVTPKVVAHVAEHATRLYPGVAIQCLLGATYGTVLGRHGCHTIRLAELDDCDVLDARCIAGVLMVVARRDNRLSRFVFRIDLTTGRYDHFQGELTAPEALDFAVLETGVCVARRGDGTLDLFPRQMGGQRVKSLTDEALDGDLRLITRGSRLGFVRGAEVGTLRMR